MYFLFYRVIFQTLRILQGYFKQLTLNIITTITENVISNIITIIDVIINFKVGFNLD